MVIDTAKVTEGSMLHYDSGKMISVATEPTERLVLLALKR